MRANEDHLGIDELRSALQELDVAILSNNSEQARQILMRIVNDYQPSAGLVDHLASGPIN